MLALQPSLEIHRSDAAKMLRRVRERAGMTLKEAGQVMEISPSLLARKERGEASVDRVDVRNAIEVYNLAPWEAYELWLAAGFVPEKTVPPISQEGLYQLAITLLKGVRYPACLSDTAGYMRAWNSPYEEIVQVDQLLKKLERFDADGRPLIHTIDLLFSDHAKSCLGRDWETFVDQSLERFYRQTLQIANEPFFPSLIERLKEQYGNEFLHQWNRVQTYVPPVDDDGHHKHHIAIDHHNPFGRIDYLILHTEYQYSPGLGLTVYMPFGDENEAQYAMLSERFMDTMVHIV